MLKIRTDIPNIAYTGIIIALGLIYQPTCATICVNMKTEGGL